ncbi:hypothetical protein P869_10380 [Ligilactobacillus ruminis S23]|nr:hypothetical protein P869_10380 [Ligilactobacillus ruminis S23]
METIEKVFNLLTETPEYVSGQQIANKLNISRTAVWKAVSSLKQRGFLIEGKTRMGYRYLPSMKLNEDEIRRYLDPALDLTFETYEQIESTNDFCKKPGSRFKNIKTANCFVRTSNRRPRPLWTKLLFSKRQRNLLEHSVKNQRRSNRSRSADYFLIAGSC